MAISFNLLLKGFTRTQRKLLARTIMTSSSRAEKFVEELEKNPYYEKYAGKIATLQQTSPEEFLTRACEQEKKHEVLRKKDTDPSQKRDFTSLLQPKKKLDGTAGATDQPLEKIMKLELVQDKDTSEIKEIWLKYHILQDVIAATIPSGEYDKMLLQAKATPLFLFPLPRTQGYEFIMSQFLNNSIHFTPLISYQVHKENAPECLTIQNYTEFKESKGIVLMRGEYDKTVLNAKEAQCLANQLQLYYNQKDEDKLKLMEAFTKQPDKFKHMDLIKQIESLKL